MNSEPGDREIVKVCQHCGQEFHGPPPRAPVTRRERVSYVSETALRLLHRHLKLVHPRGANGEQEGPAQRMARRLESAGLAMHTTIAQLIAGGNLDDRDSQRCAGSFLRDRPSVVVVCGGTGAGKSVAGWWLVSQVDGSAFLLAPTLSRPLSDASREGYLRAPLLVVDDVGLEHLGPSEYAVSQLDELVVAREMHGRPTWLSTNLTPDQFRERYGDRVFSRVMGSGGFAECAGGDARQLALVEAREPGEEG